MQTVATSARSASTHRPCPLQRLREHAARSDTQLAMTSRPAAAAAAATHVAAAAQRRVRADRREARQQRRRLMRLQGQRGRRTMPRG